MIPKIKDKEKAIKLRKLGYSYSEILKEVNISRSSLSSWLRNVKITNSQIERLRLKNEKARKLGSITIKNMRINKTREIIDKSKLEIGILDNFQLKIIGTILYWAEGSKQKEYKPSKELVFSNSDPEVIKIYLLWLKECLYIKNDDIKFEIYIHETHKKSLKELSNYWSNITNFPTNQFNKVYFKKNKVRTFRKNQGPNYHGFCEYL